MNYPLPDNVTNRWFGQRTMDFGLCLKSPVIYIKEALLLHREHGDNDGAAIDSSLAQGFGQYMLALQFAETAAQYGLNKPAARLGDAIKKISHLCLRYCVTFCYRMMKIQPCATGIWRRRYYRKYPKKPSAATSSTIGFPLLMRAKK